MWNQKYQDIYDQVKAFIRKDAYMKFYNATKLLDLQTDTSGVVLDSGLSQVG